jgi:hypothetical protein
MQLAVYFGDAQKEIQLLVLAEHNFLRMVGCNGQLLGMAKIAAAGVQGHLRAVVSYAEFVAALKPLNRKTGEVLFARQPSGKLLVRQGVKTFLLDDARDFAAYEDSVALADKTQCYGFTARRRNILWALEDIELKKCHRVEVVFYPERNIVLFVKVVGEGQQLRAQIETEGAWGSQPFKIALPSDVLAGVLKRCNADNIRFAFGGRHSLYQFAFEGHVVYGQPFVDADADKAVDKVIGALGILAMSPEPDDARQAPLSGAKEQPPANTGEIAAAPLPQHEVERTDDGLTIKIIGNKDRSHSLCQIVGTATRQHESSLEAQLSTGPVLIEIRAVNNLEENPPHNPASLEGDGVAKKS